MNKVTVIIKPPNSLNVNIPGYKVIERGGTSDYNSLTNKPTLNGVEISGDKTSEDYGLSAGSSLPDVGNDGDILTKRANGAEWVTPASDFNGDNTRPITAAAVDAIVGDINALLSTI